MFNFLCNSRVCVELAVSDALLRVQQDTVHFSLWRFVQLNDFGHFCKVLLELFLLKFVHLLVCLDFLAKEPSFLISLPLCKFSKFLSYALFNLVNSVPWKTSLPRNHRFPTYKICHILFIHSYVILCLRVLSCLRGDRKFTKGFFVQ